MTANGFALFRSSHQIFAKFIGKHVPETLFKYVRIPKNTETQQENTKENTNKTGIDQKRFPD